MHFSDRLAGIIKRKNSCLMLGLDPNWEKIQLRSEKLEARSLQEKADIYEQFCKDRLDECAQYICGIKIQMAYFEALGSVGIKAVENLVAYARDKYGEDLIIMMDAKRGDIGSTSEAYAEAFLGSESPLGGDCVTVAPYMGTDSIAPFIWFDNTEFSKGTFVLGKTSNPSSKDIQDIQLGEITIAELWAGVFEGVSQDTKNRNKKYSHMGVVIGATHPEDLLKFRSILKSCWILAPGVGAQGGKIEDVLKIRDEDGLGVLIPVSRAILYAEKPAEAMKELWEAQKI